MTAGVVRLNERQYRAFIHDDLGGAGPCTVMEDVPWAALAATDVVPNARVLMAEMADGGVRLTARGNLSRKVVERMMERFRWEGYDLEELRTVSRVFNEADYPPAGYLHAVLRLSRLARREKGMLKLTRAGRALMSDDAAGRLQAELLRTTFARYNLGYLDGADFPDVFAPQISLILYLIGQFCTGWQPADALMRSVTIPVPELTEPKYPRLPEYAFTARVLRYLCWFGLLEEGRPAANDDWRAPRVFRKTPLYDRTISFVLPR